ncbi:modifier of rpr and grim, ubiquitously expressed isoform X2 [Choristoneura fumiferana]|uniref:modifier of rpr and grim, ubiquitously expressed isoform X2 n=1 Tax=Choristoneura fumiferana TaxID=7141 RepID=UPI003D157C80
MCAVTPEYYDFIKKLEENDDKLVPSPLDLPLDFEFNNSTCHVCNGYYGPSFGEPVCVTCHAFLFPNFPSFCPNSYYYSEKTDDGDSGNDEPSDLNYSSDRRVNRVCMVPSWWYINSLDSESPEDEASNSGSVPSGSGHSNGNGNGSDQPDKADPEAEKIQPPALRPPPCLAHSLQALSTPRPPDNVAPELIAQLPTEVLLGIFGYLDDLSLSACGAVCARWRRLVRARVQPPRWAAFAARRWPLYRPLTNNKDWHKIYQSLVEACFCRNCVVQMCVQAQPPGDESAWRRNRLRIELKMMRNDPPEGIAATPLDARCCHWQASVTGPAGSPYEGGIFYLYIQVPYAYPMSPPLVRFLTRILHPNVSRHGDVGIDSVHHNWSLALTISKVLISIQSLLTDPYTAVCMEPELGEMYVRDRARFESLARRWTWRYAMQDVLPY